MAQSEFRIGIVGVGRMGANMARRLRELHYPVVAVYDTDATRAEELARELGCAAAPTLRELAEPANTVLTVVSDDAAMRRIFSSEAADSLLRQAAGRLFINCATLSPALQREVHTLVEQEGGQCLEACMASSITQARQGTLYLMCGGRREVFERASPLLKALSAHLRLIGPAGEAANVKALVNMVMNANTAALAEGLGLGSALGLDLTMLREVFSQTGANSRVLETDGEDMQSRAHDCYFSASHAAKDSGIACVLAEQAGLDLPVAKAAYEQYRRLVAIGKGEMDKSAIAELTFKGRTGA
ncbi:MAG: NAD(P)-dependent oxidoreductase [Nitrospira sp.]|nr:NAD(P)-dependent oxidoreductase [Nitrospira sp.]